MNKCLALLLSASLLCLPGAAPRAFSSGAPICEVDDILNSPMGFHLPPQVTPYFVRFGRAGYLEDEGLTIRIEENGFWSAFNGVLLYIEDPDTDDGTGHPKKVGSFVGPTAPSGYRFKTDCDPSGDNLVLTHDGGMDQTTPVEFAWKAPSSNLGTLRLRGIVLRAGGEFPFDNAPYQIYSIDLPYGDGLFNDGFE
jgi:hypothetical protein